MWKQRLSLGTYFRIGVYVHWSFALLLGYVAYAGFQDGPAGMAFGVALLLGMFFCVTLHEYGHALTARRFGIETMDITLFPIGGVARLMKIPRIPWQEFLVAVAGPAVNVVIIFVIMTSLLTIPAIGMPGPMELLTDPDSADQIDVALNRPSVLGYLLSMMLVNTALVIFNMIPAFPMDGGRVLRSILAMGLEYRRATRIAALVGVVCSMCMFGLALYFERPMPGLIAVFICYAGLSEARQVDLLEPLRHLRVGDAMDHAATGLSIDAPLDEVVRHFGLSPQAAVAVVGLEGIVTGVLLSTDVSQALRDGAFPETTAGQLARHDGPTLSPHEPLESVITRPLNGRRQFAVTDSAGKLLGLLDLDNLRVRAEMVI